MKDYDVYLFDWDGTLAETIGVWMDALREAYMHYGIEASDEQIVPGLGDWRYAHTLGVPEDAFLDFKARVEAAAAVGVATPPLFEGVIALLDDLKSRDKKIALISTSRRSLIDAVIAHHQLGDYFDIMISGDEVSAHKPDPEGILRALDYFAVEPSQAIMIGDSDKDLGAAINAGVDSLLFYPEAHQAVYSREFLMTFKPVHTIEHWSHWNGGVISAN